MLLIVLSRGISKMLKAIWHGKLQMCLNSSTIDELGEGTWKDRGAQ